ncbi:hypothetical protein [Stenotrophomonas maltophilia]
MSRSTGWSLGLLVGGLSTGLVIAGLLLTCQAAIMATLSVHLIALLSSIGLAPSLALLAGMIIGPAQVVARLLEMYCGRGVHPTWSARAGVAATLVALLLLTGYPWVAIIAFVIYGAGNGIRTVARGTLPLAVIGSADYGKTMGQLARPMLMAQAAAPPLAAIALERTGPIPWSEAVGCQPRWRARTIECD